MVRYVIYKYGERATKKKFTNLSDAIDYYDKQCRTAKGYKVVLMNDDNGAILYHNTAPDSLVRYSVGQYRDVSAEKKKKKDTDMHPFGL